MPLPGSALSTFCTACQLHVPHKEWADDPLELINYLTLERWSQQVTMTDHISSTPPIGGRTPGANNASGEPDRRLDLHIPHPNWSPNEMEQANYATIENWAALVMHSYPFIPVTQPVNSAVLHDIHSKYDLHIPHKNWASDTREWENYMAIERWASFWVPLLLRAPELLLMIHRYWSDMPGDPPTDTGPSVDLWHPGQRHDWTDRELPAELADWCAARFDAVKTIDLPRHNANMVRWWLLWHHGGVWLDHDVTLLKPLPEGEWLVYHGDTICPSMISLSAGHPLAAAMLDHIQTVAPSERTCLDVSGSHVVTRLVDEMHPIIAVYPISGVADHAHATSLQRLESGHGHH